MDDDFRFWVANDNAPCRRPARIFRFRCAADKSADPLSQQKVAKWRFDTPDQIQHRVYDGNLRRVKSVINDGNGPKTIYNIYDAGGKLVHIFKASENKKIDYVAGPAPISIRIIWAARKRGPITRVPSNGANNIRHSGNNSKTRRPMIISTALRAT